MHRDIAELSAGHVRAGNTGMPQLPYVRRMDEIALLEALAAHDAAEALIALGWPIQPHGPDAGHWRIGDLIMTDEDLIGLATRRGIRPASERVQ